MFYFCTPKTWQSQRFSDIFNVYRKENGLRLIQPVFHFEPPITSENQNLLMLLGGIEMEHRFKMD